MAGSLLPDLCSPIHSLPQNLSQPGVYFLLSHGEVVYVGQAGNMWRRIGQHMEQNTKQFDSVAYVWCEKAKRNEIERHYIERYLPKYNQCGMSQFLRSVGFSSEAPPPPKPEPIISRRKPRWSSSQKRDARVR